MQQRAISKKCDDAFCLYSSVGLALAFLGKACCPISRRTRWEDGDTTGIEYKQAQSLARGKPTLVTSTMQTIRQPTMNRWWRVVGGMSMNLALGTLYGWSVFVAPLE